MEQRVIDALEERAKRVIWHVGRRYGQDFSGYSWEQYANDSLEVDIPTAGALTFSIPGNPYAKVKFTGIAPVGVSRKIFHEPVNIGSEINDVATTTVVNESQDITLTRDYSLSIEESKTFQESVGVSVELELRQMFSYGGDLYGFTGETEITATVGTEYSKEWGGEETVTRDNTTSFDVPPRTEVVLVSKNAVSKFEQHCEYWCDLEHTVTLWSDGDFRHEYSSYNQLLQTVAGKSPNTVPEAAAWRSNPLNVGNQVFLNHPVEVHFEETVRFDKAVSGNVVLTSREL